MSYSSDIPGWQKVLLAISRSPRRARYCERLNRAVKLSRTHLRRLVGRLADSNLITIKKDKHIKRLDLTEKGERLVSVLREVKIELQSP